jgi:hypothetical protein
MIEKVEKPWGFQIVQKNDDTGEVEAIVASIVKDRRLFIDDEDTSLDPNTLIGSHFLTFVDHVCVWKGAIVAEPMQGRYLCHIDLLEEGIEQVQRLIPLDVFMGSGPRRFIENAYGQTAAVNIENERGEQETVIERATAEIMAPQIEWRLYDNEEKAQKAYAAWVAIAAAKAAEKEQHA